MTKKYDKLGSLLYSNDKKKHQLWTDKILSFDIGITPPNDWIQGHFYATNNEAPHNHDLLWDMVTNMLDWADRESPWHSEMVGMFGSEIEQSLNGSNGRAYDTNDAGKTKDELRETIMECKQEIIEKTEILYNEYIEVLNKVEY